LRECIESCLEQDYPNIEIVVADDASTDGTQEMLREYDQNYPGKFALCFAPTNQGITLNSNAAHFLCKGKYISWMGGDDLMLKGKISKQVNYMESNPDCSICYHNLEVFNSNTGFIRYYNEKFKLSGDVRLSIRNGTFNGACSNMVRADKTPAHGFDKSLLVASDWLYWVETLVNGGTINYIDEVLGRYRRHDSNVTLPSQCVTQNELDHLFSCHIIMVRYPIFASDALYAYSNNIISLNYKFHFFQNLFPLFLNTFIIFCKKSFRSVFKALHL
jgi:glycosyltransferase involved in cell wall biosynthesis